MSPTESEAGSRPRVEGDREQEILDAAIDVLADVGYDRLTMDAVAAKARASKATLYRRFNSKAELVIAALLSEKQPQRDMPDTGTLRGDLLAAYCGMGGLTDEHTTAILASVITAIARDADFAEAFRRDFIGPKVELGSVIYTRAKQRGEIGEDVDVSLLGPALAGIVLHRRLLLGEIPDPAYVEAVVDQIILPAAGVRPATQNPRPDRNDA